MFITLDYLKRIGVCTNGQDLFYTTFGEQANVNLANVMLAISKGLNIHFLLRNLCIPIHNNARYIFLENALNNKPDQGYGSESSYSDINHSAYSCVGAMYGCIAAQQLLDYAYRIDQGRELLPGIAFINFNYYGAGIYDQVPVCGYSDYCYAEANDGIACERCTDMTIFNQWLREFDHDYYIPF